MRNFAHEFVETLHAIGTLDDFNVKTADAKDCAVIQGSVAKSCNDFYTVMCKEAMARTDINNPRHMRVVAFVEKLASYVRPAPLPMDFQYKFAAAIMADDAITTLAENTQDKRELAKLAEARLYGREFTISLLRKVF